MSNKTLKAEYAKWLWMLLTADVVVLLFLVPGISSGSSIAELANWRLLTTVLIPVVVALFVNVLPNAVKCMLVYWRPLGWLPGFEVFTKYGPSDPRVDMEALERHVGQFPIDPFKQNSRWYQLYKMIEDEAEIREAQKSFLMYRDMAALSVPFIPLAPIFLYKVGATAGDQWLGAVLFVAQYLLTALSARHTGIRYVTNVVAVHSARRIPDQPQSTD